MTFLLHGIIVQHHIDVQWMNQLDLVYQLSRWRNFSSFKFPTYGGRVWGWNLDCSLTLASPTNRPPSVAMWLLSNQRRNIIIVKITSCFRSWWVLLMSRRDSVVTGEIPSSPKIHSETRISSSLEFDQGSQPSWPYHFYPRHFCNQFVEISCTTMAFIVVSTSLPNQK